jgi:outer membrane receptor for Fe3+-dicitrate
MMSKNNSILLHCSELLEHISARFILTELYLRKFIVTNHAYQTSTFAGTKKTSELNLLKPSGNFIYDQVNIKNSTWVPTLRLCVLYRSQNKQQLLPYKTLRDWFL